MPSKTDKTDKTETRVKVPGAPHNYYIECECGAHYSDTIDKCLACGKANPELAPTLNAAEPGEKPPASRPSPAPSSPTLNAKEK